ncbi:MAG: PilZ domain-containing protein [Nitrospirota bacterium]|nr:PilZ domain-containing protein [Nitrospirota bacterium]
MLNGSDIVIKRVRHQCPQCEVIIPEAYIEQNPFPEFPCPSCGKLIDTVYLKNVDLHIKDERKDERFNAALKISYTSYNEFISEYTKDVSNGGMLINTKRHHEVNDIIDLSLNVPGLDTPIKIKGEVVRVKIHNVKDEDAGIGVKFIEIDTESRKALIDFIRMQNACK